MAKRAVKLSIERSAGGSHTYEVLQPHHLPVLLRVMREGGNRAENAVKVKVKRTPDGGPVTINGRPVSPNCSVSTHVGAGLDLVLGDTTHRLMVTV